MTRKIETHDFYIVWVINDFLIRVLHGGSASECRYLFNSNLNNSFGFLSHNPLVFILNQSQHDEVNNTANSNWREVQRDSAEIIPLRNLIKGFDNV